MQNQPLLLRENRHFSSPNFTSKPKNVKTKTTWNAGSSTRVRFGGNKKVTCGDFENFDRLAQGKT